jgi:hypothetical protein
MSFARKVPRVAAIAVLMLFPLAAYAITVDRVTVTGRAESRETAILYAEQSAVQIVAGRYIANDMTDQERLTLIDQVLPHSKYYMHAFEILEERVDEAGFTEIVALARIEVGRLVTTLRNLDIAVTLFDPGPNAVVEGRR